MVPDAIRGRLLVKFVVVVVAVALLVGGIGVVLQQQVSATLTDQKQSEMRTIAELTAGETEQWVKDNRQTVRMISWYEAARSGDPAEASAAFEYEMISMPASAEKIYYVNKSTKRIASSSVEGSDEDVGSNIGDLGMKWVDENGDEKGFFFDTVQDTTVSEVFQHNGKSLMAFASPAASSVAGATDYVVVMTVNVTTRAQNFHNAIDGGFTQVLNKSGVVQFDRDDDEILQSYAGPDSVLESRSVGVTESSGQLIATVPIEGTGWMVVSHAPVSNAYAIESQVTQNILLLIVIALSGFVVIGATIGRNTIRSLSDLRGKARSLEKGNLDTTIETDRIDEIGDLYTAFSSMRDALKEQIQEARQARKEAEVSRAEALEMSNYLQGKADEYAQIMQQVGAGDLTRRMDPDGENEAMDRIAGEFNDMIDELEKTTGQLKSFADEVETAGEVVQNSSESVRDASEQVADSIQRISDDAYDQRDRLEEISRTIDEVADDLEAVAAEHDVDFQDDLDRIEEVASTLAEVVELSEETMAEAENVAGAAEEQAAELNEVSQRAEDLTRYAGPLRDVLDRFETESEHEFYFPTGPGTGDDTPAGAGGDR